MLNIATERAVSHPFTYGPLRQRPALRFGKVAVANEWITNRSQVKAGILKLCVETALSEESRLRA